MRNTDYIPALAGISLAASLFLAASAACASNTSDIYYGRGVQAFLDEDWRRAEAYFNRAISYAPGNPQAYYFRGLARQRLGMSVEAEADIRQGATLESGKGRTYQIGVALAGVASQDGALLTRIRTEMLADLPTRSAAQGLPAAERRHSLALRPKFSLPIESLSSLNSPAELTQLVDSARAKLALSTKAIAKAPSSGPASPSAVADVPEAARGSMKASEIAGVFTKPLTGALSWVSKMAGGQASAGTEDPFGAPVAEVDDANFGGDSDDPFGGGDPFGGPGADNGPDPFGDDPFGDPEMGGSEQGDGQSSDEGEMNGGSLPFDEGDPFVDDPPGVESGDPFGADEDPFG